MISTTSEPITPSWLHKQLDMLGIPISPVAVALSGGPDSMALTWLLSQTLGAAGHVIHAVTVDHDLRPQSAKEAEAVGDFVASFPGVRHTIIKRPKPDSNTRIMEKARQDRYRLLTEYCRAHALRHLFTAHHQDDQAETFLFRLAKGSGLGGLGAMRPLTELADGIMLCRPLLDISKQSLIAACHAHSIPYVADDSNADPRYARARLRQAADILAAEGLTPRRIGIVAKRLNRAREALDFVALKSEQECLLYLDKKRVVFTFSGLQNWPAEIRYRVLRRACLYLCTDFDTGRGNYGPHMDRLEIIAADLFATTKKRSATVKGCLLTASPKHDTLEITREQKG